MRENHILAPTMDQVGLMRLKKLAPKPRRIEETGLSITFLSDLTAKHLLQRGTLSISELAQGLSLAGAIVESVLNFMRTESLIEVRPNRAGQPGLHYALTDRGRGAGLDAMLRSGYCGPAPVPLNLYTKVANAQSVHNQTVSREAMLRAFRDIVLDHTIVNRLGASMNSGRAIFLYGSAGTGKSYIAQKLMRLFPDATLVPHALLIENNVIQLFDPLVHQTINVEDVDQNFFLDQGHDQRFVVCKRPAVITGGELTADMLEVRYEPTARLYEAPLQLKANNGVFVIDDLGRQRVDATTVFNRWIVPLEEKKDFHTLQSGKHFSVPFDVVLIFSTNIHPLELADEAFLRRIGYKIEFKSLSPDDYERIWRDTCVEFEIDFDAELVNYAINELHNENGVDLLPCHPRDLLGMALDNSLYTENGREIGVEQLRWAWRNYFVPLQESSPTSNYRKLF